MQVYKIPRKQWTYYLAPQLTGKAQQVFVALPLGESKAYDGVKTAILLRYSVSEETYWRRFRTASRKNRETHRELAMRFMNLQNIWLKAHTTMQGIKEAIGIEQFLNSLSMEERAWVSDKKPTTCVQAGELAYEYELARNQNQEPQNKVDNPP